jgi:hypothetical protein
MQELGQEIGTGFARGNSPCNKCANLAYLSHTGSKFSTFLTHRVIYPRPYNAGFDNENQILPQHPSSFHKAKLFGERE